MRELLDAEKFFYVFIKKMKERINNFPTYEASWTHNILSIVSEMGRENGYFPWYEKERIDCTWHVRPDEYSPVVLSCEYEDWPKCIHDIRYEMERVDKVKKEFFVAEPLKVMIYCIDGYKEGQYKFNPIPTEQMIERDKEEMEKWKLKGHWLVVPFYCIKSAQKVTFVSFEIQNGIVKSGRYVEEISWKG